MHGQLYTSLSSFLQDGCSLVTIMGSSANVSPGQSSLHRLRTSLSVYGKAVSFVPIVDSISMGMNEDWCIRVQQACPKSGLPANRGLRSGFRLPAC